MRAFTVIPMQIRKTILRQLANHHTFVCVHGENRGSRWDEEWKNYGSKPDTVVLRENPGFKMTLWWQMSDLKLSPLISLWILFDVEAPRKTLEQFTLASDLFFFHWTKNKKRKESWGQSTPLPLRMGSRHEERRGDKWRKLRDGREIPPAPACFLLISFIWSHYILSSTLKPSCPNLWLHFTSAVDAHWRAAKNPQKCLLCSIKNAFCASPLFIKNVVSPLPSSRETVARSRSGDHLKKQGFVFRHKTEHKMSVNDCFFLCGIIYIYLKKSLTLWALVTFILIWCEYVMFCAKFNSDHFLQV